MPESPEHVWVAAATVPLNLPQVKRAILRHSVWLTQERVDILEVYCANCRRPWDDVATEECSAMINNEHLRGGPIGERRKRKHNHNCQLLGCFTEPPAVVNG